MTIRQRTRTVLTVLTALLVLATSLVSMGGRVSAQSMGSGAGDLVEIHVYRPLRLSFDTTVEMSLSSSASPAAVGSGESVLTAGWDRVIFTVPRSAQYRYLRVRLIRFDGANAGDLVVTPLWGDDLVPLGIESVSATDWRGRTSRLRVGMAPVVPEPDPAAGLVEIRMTWDAARALPRNGASLNLHRSAEPWDTLGRNSSPSSGFTSEFTVPLTEQYRYLHAFVRGEREDEQKVITQLWDDNLVPLIESVTLTDDQGRTGEVTFEFRFLSGQPPVPTEPTVPTSPQPVPTVPTGPQPVPGTRALLAVEAALTGRTLLPGTDELAVVRWLAEPDLALPVVELIRADLDVLNLSTSGDATTTTVTVAASPSGATQDFVFNPGDPLVLQTADLCSLSLQMGHPDSCIDSPPVPHPDICERFLLTLGRCDPVVIPAGVEDLVPVLTSRNFSEVEQFFQEPELVAELQQAIYDGLAEAGLSIDVGTQALVEPNALLVELGISGFQGSPVRFERNSDGVWQMTTESLCGAAAPLGPICAGDPLRPVANICAQPLVLPCASPNA